MAKTISLDYPNSSHRYMELKKIGILLLGSCMVISGPKLEPERGICTLPSTALHSIATP